MSRSLLALVRLLPALLAVLAVSAAPTNNANEPDPSLAVTVQINGKSFVNKGLVAFGRILSNATDSIGDTIGGIGSAIAMKRNTFRKNWDGTYSGTLVVQPDRGFNINGTIDYRGRHHDIDFTMTPYYGTANLSFDDAQKTMALTYRRTLLYFDRNRSNTTGLDALAVRKQTPGFPNLVSADPPIPIPAQNFNHISVDCEGLALNADGTFWMSDEYGPYVYRFSPQGIQLTTIEPPQAIIPFLNGTLNFTSETNPTTGRTPNQGFEGLTVSPDGNTLFALLQSATIQDGGNGKNTSRFTRLFRYDVSNVDFVRPKLTGEWVVPLPLDSKGNTLAQSETHFINDNMFFVLSRDGDGHGGNNAKSSYKQADIIDITHATDIHGSKFDDPSHPISPNGVLDKSITPAVYTGFVNFLNVTQLARLGLHNGKPEDDTQLDAKWESIALAPVQDPKFPNDYFLFTASDNDFLSTQGRFDGQSFNAGLDNDNQFMVFRLTLPTIQKGTVERSIGI